MQAGVNHFLVSFAFFALASSLVSAASGPPLVINDFCVAPRNISNAMYINGRLCKNPSSVDSEDFYFDGLDRDGNTSNRRGFAATLVNVGRIPGLNTLSVSLIRYDFAPRGGQSYLHTHPSGSEILTLIKGRHLLVGFVTSRPSTKLFTKVLNEGGVFVFPKGCIHFQKNMGDKRAVALSSFSSEEPGAARVFPSVFASDPPIPTSVVASDLGTSRRTVERIRSNLE